MILNDFSCAIKHTKEEHVSYAGAPLWYIPTALLEKMIMNPLFDAIWFLFWTCLCIITILICLIHLRSADSSYGIEVLFESSSILKTCYDAIRTASVKEIYTFMVDNLARFCFLPKEIASVDKNLAYYISTTKKIHYFNCYLVASSTLGKSASRETVLHYLSVSNHEFCMIFHPKLDF